MTFVRKPGSGSLFPNDRKTQDNHPDHKGKINIDGVEYWLSAWDKEGRNGTFLSLSIGKPVEAQQAPQRAPVRSAPTARRPPAQQRRPSYEEDRGQPMQGYDDTPYDPETPPF